MFTKIQNIRENKGKSHNNSWIMFRNVLSYYRKKTAGGPSTAGSGLCGGRAAIHHAVWIPEDSAWAKSGEIKERKLKNK